VIAVIGISILIIKLLEKQEMAQVQFKLRDMSHVLTEKLNLYISFSDDYSLDSMVELEYSPVRFPGNSTTPWFQTADAGSLEVSFHLTALENDTISEGRLAIPLRGDWQWDIMFTVSSYDPLTGCWGCFGSRAFALDPAYQDTIADSVHVVWGGNYISHPVIY